MDSAIIISIAILLVFIVFTVRNLLLPKRQETGPSPSPSSAVGASGASVQERVVEVRDAETAGPPIEYDGEYSAVDEDGSTVILTEEDNYDPYDDPEDDYVPEPVLSGADVLNRDFWFNWDQAATSEGSEEKIREYSRILADNGLISQDQAKEIAEKSIAYAKQAVKDAQQPHSGIFSEDYTFPKEPEKVYIEY